MPSHPLTHHEIFALVEPFTRSGYHVDLGATDRAARRLVFKVVDRAADAPALGGLWETVELDAASPADARLTRTLRTGRETARLAISGAAPAELLRCVHSIGPLQHFRPGPDACVAFDFDWRLESGAAGPPPLRLRRAVATVRALRIELQMPDLEGEPAAIRLTSDAGAALVVPQDLLAVLGRAWSPLIEGTEGWRGRLRLARAEPVRSRRAQSDFETAVRHVANTLREPPGRFHQRWAAARWRVYGRRSLPLLGCVALIAATAALPRAHLAERSAWRMLIFNLPPLLMGLFFCLREIPRIEIPPVPRPLRAPAWREPQAD